MLEATLVVMKKINERKTMHLSGFEPETSRVWSERDHHYTTGALPSQDLYHIFNWFIFIDSFPSSKKGKIFTKKIFLSEKMFRRKS